jgi:DNA-binding transcriptional regulator LsrR (DeoR family)
LPRWKRLRKQGRLSRKEIEKRTGRTPAGHIAQSRKDRLLEVALWVNPQFKGYNWRYTLAQLSKMFDISTVTIGKLIKEPRDELRRKIAIRMATQYHAGVAPMRICKRYGISHTTLMRVVKNMPGQHPKMKLYDDDER